MENKNRNIPFEKLEFISIVLKAISHPIRLNIIEILEHGKEVKVQDIAHQLDNKIEQSLLSHHLIKMKDKGILSCRKEGVFKFYSLKIKEISKLLDCMENCPVI